MHTDTKLTARGWLMLAALFSLSTTVAACGDSDESRGADETRDSVDAEGSDEGEDSEDEGSESSPDAAAEPDAEDTPDAGASEDPDTTQDAGRAQGESKDDAGENTENDEGALFAVPTEVYGADFATSTSYVSIVPSLDVDEISLDDARELDGRASIAAVGKWLFMASSSAPVVERFEVRADGSLKPDGSLNFMNYGVPEFFAIDAWGAVFVDADKAYIFNGTDGSHIVWNPTTLEITGEIPAPDIVQEGYNLESVAVVQGDRMYRIFTFLNYDSWEFLPAPQYLAVYDVESDELIDLVEESRCPQLYSRPFVDEAGDIYFSGWVWTPGLTLTSDYPKSCALRVKAGQDSFDPNWQLNFAQDLTEGREAGIMRYLGDGKALLDVFHAERTTIDDSTDAQELANTPNWRLWTIDLEAKTGAPLEGLDFKAGGYTDIEVGDRTFLMVPNEDYSETTAYEIEAGEAVPGFKIQGSAYHMLKLR